MENRITDFSNENKNKTIKIDNYDNSFRKEQDTLQSSSDKAYSDIFNEMLYLENLMGLQDKTKYCLVRLWIKNLDELTSLSGFDNKDDFLSKFSGILTMNRRGADVYLKTEESSFLILFPGTTIGNIELALKRIESIILKKFNAKVELEWRIVKASNKEEDITPFINKADLENKTKSSSPVKGHKRASLRNLILSFSIFFGIILILGISIYFTEQRFSFIPEQFKFGVILSSLNLGFLINFNSAIAILIFFVLTGLAFSVVFKLFGVFMGWVIKHWITVIWRHMKKYPIYLITFIRRHRNTYPSKIKKSDSLK